MKTKQLAAILLAGVLTAGMMPSAAFAEAVPVTIEENSGAPEGTADVAPVTEAEPEVSVDTPAPETPVDTPAPEVPAEPTPETQTSEVPDTPTPETPVPAEPTPEIPAADTPTPETPPTEAAQPAPQSEDPSNIGQATAGTVAKIGEQEFKTIQEAVAAAPTGVETEIELVADVLLENTVEIPAGKAITLTSAVDVSIERSEAFLNHMFIIYGTLKMNVTGTGMITILGDLSSQQNVSGYIVYIPLNSYGTFQIENGINLINNMVDVASLQNGSAIVNNSSSGCVKIYGGQICNNSGGAGAGIYSKGKVYVKGATTVGDNVNVVNSEASNIVLDGSNATLVLDGSMTGKIALSLAEQNLGTQVVELGDGVTNEMFQESLPNITYEKPFYKIGINGFLVSDAFLKSYGAGKWINHNSASISFEASYECKYYITWVPISASNDEIMNIEFDDALAKSLARDTKVSDTIYNLPEQDVLIVLIAKATVRPSNFNIQTYINHAIYRIEGERPVDPNSTPTPTPEASPSPTPEASPSPTPEASPSPTPEASPSPTPTDTPVEPSVTPTTVPSRAPIVPGVNETVVTGFENPLDFTRPNVSYTFTVTGAGTANRNSAVKGDVMWEPLYFSTVSNPSDSQKIYPNNGVWSIAIKNGGTIVDTKTIPVYVWCRKYEFDGSQWVNLRRIEAKVTSFQTAAATDGSGTITDPNDPNYTGDPTSAPLDFGSEAGTNKSAVNTADNTPIAMFMTMAFISLAGIFAVVRMRRGKIRK